ncbi:MAG: YfiM family protein, partial [Ignavibacteriaceae bacterium]|nr:YfiM family protein [Ignavibacteriaceae bacterium]
MNLVTKILPVFFIISFFSAYGQDSTNSNSSIKTYFIASRLHLYENNLSHFNYKLPNPSSVNGHTFPSQPTLINNERPLIDGTIWRTYSDIDYLRLSSMIGVMATANTVAYMYQRKVWYTENTTVFHTLEFMQDWNKYQQMDKFGHFSDAYFTSDLAGKIYRWSGFSGNTSVWLGALSGWAWMLEIEVSDAFMAEWG